MDIPLLWSTRYWIWWAVPPSKPDVFSFDITVAFHFILHLFGGSEHLHPKKKITIILMSYICHRGWIPFFWLFPARWPLHRHLGRQCLGFITGFMVLIDILLIVCFLFAFSERVYMAFGLGFKKKNFLVFGSLYGLHVCIPRVMLI